MRVDGLCVLVVVALGTTSCQELSVNRERLFQSLLELGEIGGYVDEATGANGVRRVGLSEADGATRRRVVQWLEDANLDVTVDQAGNIFALRHGLNSSLAPVMTGSHVDSVYTGGRFDGPLGVLGALEVVRTLNDNDVVTRRPILLAIYADEEGRFGNKPGSAAATGKVPLAEVLSYRDLEGFTYGEELQKIGFDGVTPVNEVTPFVHLELHIEQGPLLKRSNIDIGVVTSIPAITRYELDIRAVGGHAGATPIEYRSDAGLAAAAINVKLREMMASGRYGADMRVTMGIIETIDGSENVIPSHVRTSIDLRNSDDTQQERVIEDIKAYAELVKDRDVEITWSQRSSVVAALMADGVMAVVQSLASARSLSARRMPSGAGHDTANWAPKCPVGMIFVPGELDGISHNPLEFSSEKQCGDGADVLLDSVLYYAEVAKDQ